MILERPVQASCPISLRFGPYTPDLQKLTGRPFHFGIDFAPPPGSLGPRIDILAAADGTVLRTGFDTSAGRYILVSHITAQGLLLTQYLHLSSITTARNNIVMAGEKIGTMGASGIVTAPHLHFGFSRLRLDSLEHLDPALYLKATNV